ncbi:MAG: hypothetical protein AB1941_30985 [Gemmatimonadota bacterium]
MKNYRAFLAAGLLALALTACGESYSTPTAADAPRFNGFGFGSGHRAESDSSGTDTTPPATGVATAGDDSTTLRNGSGFGSGN